MLSVGPCSERGRIRLIKTLGFAAILLLAVACAANPLSPGADAKSSANSCQIDAQKICESVKDLHNTAVSGYADSQSQREQNLAPTQSWIKHFTTPDQTEIEVQCDLNIRHHKIIYAHALSGPALTENDVNYLRNQGLCLNGS